MQSIKQGLEFLREICSDCDERFEMPDILGILLATLFVGPSGLGAHQGLGRSDALGLMSHVQLVTFDRLVQVLATIFTDAEPVDLLTRISRKSFQLAAIGAAAL
jgi:hypothetical protein